MASAIGKVAAVFTASTSGLTSGVNQAKSAFASLERSARATANGMRSLVAIQGIQLFGSVASQAAKYVRSMESVGAAQAAVVDRSSKLAARLGMTYGQFAGLALAGDLAGVSMDSLAAAATKSDVALANAVGGSKQANAAFARLGLVVGDLSKMNAADRFDAIASAIAGLPSEAERAAAAVQLFGRSGAELLPLFADGANAISAARQEAERFGLALTTAQGKDIEGMNDAFTRAQKAVEGVVTQVIARLSPAITGIVNSFSKFISDVGGVDIGKMIGEGILDGAEYLASVADWLVTNLSGVWNQVSGVADNWRGVITFMDRVAAGFRAVGLGLVSAFIGIVRVAITPISILIENVASLASNIPGAIGEAAKGVVSIQQGVRGTLDSAAKNLGEIAGSNLNYALSGSAEEAGKDLVGPWQKTVQEFRRVQRDSADAAEEVKSTPIKVDQVVQVAGIQEAVKGIDSRSKEGVAEMFRLMRGGRANIDEQQLSVLEQIAENTSAGDNTLALDY